MRTLKRLCAALLLVLGGCGTTPSEFARREVHDWRDTFGLWSFVNVGVGFYCVDLDTGYYVEGPASRMVGARVTCGPTGGPPNRDYIDYYPPPSGELHPEGRHPRRY